MVNSIRVLLDGGFFTHLSDPDGLGRLIDDSGLAENRFSIDSESLNIWQASRQNSAVRKRISESAGDTLSMLGTTADAAALATLGMAALTVSVANSNNFADFKAAFLGALSGMSGSQDMVAISAAFLGKIEAGEVVIPAMAKGMDVVIADIEQRSTAVSQALLGADSG
jgi:hypothetical protein